MTSLPWKSWWIRWWASLIVSVVIFCQSGPAPVARAEEAAPAATVTLPAITAETTSDPAKATPAVVAAGDYLIGPADQLEVVLWKEEELSRKVQVRVDGWISVPLVGDVKAAGKTVAGLARELTELYGKVLEDPAITVMLLEGRSYRYFMIGKVRNPGEYRIEAPVSLLQAIARSGGFAEWAKTDDVLLVRKGSDKQEIMHFDYDAFVKGKNIDKNVEIVPGDVIVVP